MSNTNSINNNESNIINTNKRSREGVRFLNHPGQFDDAAIEESGEMIEDGLIEVVDDSRRSCPSNPPPPPPYPPLGYGTTTINNNNTNNNLPRSSNSSTYASLLGGDSFYSTTTTPSKKSQSRSRSRDRRRRRGSNSHRGYNNTSKRLPPPPPQQQQQQYPHHHHHHYHHPRDCGGGDGGGPPPQPPPWFHHNHNHHHHRPPPPRRLQLPKPPPPHPSFSNDRNDNSSRTASSPPPSAPSAKEELMMSEFERAEMTKVIAKNISGSELHQSILQKLKDRGWNGMTSSAMSWAFSSRLSEEIHRYCKDVYHIPSLSSCISVTDVLKELDGIQFQYNYDKDNSLRFYISESLLSSSSLSSKTKTAATTTTISSNHNNHDYDVNSSESKDAAITHAKIDDDFGGDVFAIAASNTNNDVKSTTKDAATTTEEAKAINMYPHPGSSKQEQLTRHRNNNDDMNGLVENSSQVQNITTAVTRTPKDDRRCTEEVISKAVRSSTNKGKPSSSSSSNPDNNKNINKKPAFTADNAPKDTSLANVLDCLLEKQEGWPCLQALLMLLRRNKKNRNNETTMGCWPTTRTEVQSFVLDLWSRRNDGDYLPTRLKQWLSDQLEGYPSSHLRERAKYIAGRLVFSYQKSKCLFLTTTTAANNQELAAAANNNNNNPVDDKKPAAKAYRWDLDHVIALTDLFVKEKGPQLPKEEEEEPKQEVQVKVPVATAVNFKLKKEEEDDDCDEYIELLELEQEEEQLDAKEGILRADLAQQHTDQDSSGCLRKESDSEKCSIAEEERDPLDEALENVRIAADGFSALDFLVMLKENYNGRIWPSTSNELKMCVEAVIGTVKNHHHHPAHHYQQQQGSQLLPRSLRLYVGKQLNDFPFKIVVPRVLEGFLLHYQDLECLEIKEKEQQEKNADAAKSSGGLLVWKMERIDAIKDHLLNHPHPLQQQPECVERQQQQQQQKSQKNRGNAANDVENPATECEIIEINDTDDEEEDSTKNDAFTPTASTAGGNEQQAMMTKPNRDNSLVELAALDVLYLMKNHRGSWPIQRKAIARFLEARFQDTTMPKHLVQLQKELIGRNMHCTSFKKVVCKVLPEIQRLGGCSWKGKVKWFKGPVNDLLKRHKICPAPDANSQRNDSSTSPTPKRQRDPNGGSSTKDHNEPNTSKRARSKRQRESFASSPLNARGEVCPDESFIPSPIASCTPPSKRQKTSSKIQQTPTLDTTKARKHRFGFDMSRGYALVRVDKMNTTELATVLMPTPPLVSNDVQAIMDLLPDDLAVHLQAVQEQLSEIVLDKGRQLVAWSAGGNRVNLSSTSRSITNTDIASIVHKIGGFGADNRAGLDEQLHRIAAVRNKQQEIVGLTLQVRSRYVSGGASIIADILYADPTKSVLFLGEPGTGKTMLLREVACCLSEKSKVVIVDTSNEIAGDGDVPHACLGMARRIMVPSLNEQANVISQCVANHTPDCIVVDKFGLPGEVEAARACKDQCIRLIGSAQGSFRQLIQNPRLRGLIDSSLPIFDIVVELQSPHKWNIIENTALTLECIRNGKKFNLQCRSRDPISGNFQIKRKKDFMAKQVSAPR